MRVSPMSIENFRGIENPEFQFSGHALLFRGTNVAKITICEALSLVLCPYRLTTASGK